MKIEILRCPSCGAGVASTQKNCDYCDNPIIITTFNSVNGMSSLQLKKYAKSYSDALEESPKDITVNTALGMCYLKLKLYDNAIMAFDKAIETNFDNSETFFYAAVSLLSGKIAFVQKRETINKILEYINAAIEIEPRAIYYYFLAYIKYDYFKRKFFNITPDYSQELRQAMQAGVSHYDKSELFEILGVEKPEQF